MMTVKYKKNTRIMKQSQFFMSKKRQCRDWCLKKLLIIKWSFFTNNFNTHYVVITMLRIKVSHSSSRNLQSVCQCL